MSSYTPFPPRPVRRGGGPRRGGGARRVRHIDREQRRLGPAGGAITLQSDLSSPLAETGDAGPGRRVQQAEQVHGEAQHGGGDHLPAAAADVPDLREPAGHLHVVRGQRRRPLRLAGAAARRQRSLEDHGQLPGRAQVAEHRHGRQADLRAHRLLLVGRVLPQVPVRQVGPERADDLVRLPEAVPRPSSPRTSYRSASARRARTAWVASAWFDYFDIRLNGADFHRALLQGKHSFTDPKVVDIFNDLEAGAAVLRPERHRGQLAGGHQPAPAGPGRHAADRHLLRRRGARRARSTTSTSSSSPSSTRPSRTRRRRRPTACSPAHARTTPPAVHGLHDLDGHAGGAEPVDADLLRHGHPGQPAGRLADIRRWCRRARRCWPRPAS